MFSIPRFVAVTILMKAWACGATDTPDYVITTTSGTLTITDSSGNNDALAISEPVRGSIAFAAAGRTFQVNSGSIVTDSSGSISLIGVTQITVNAGAGDDRVTVGGFADALPSLTINGGTGDDAVSFDGDITFAANAPLDVDLLDDHAAPGTDTITFSAAVTFSGSGGLTARSSKNIALLGSLVSVNGDLVLEANQQATPSFGGFDGIAIGGTVHTTGSGSITLKGRGCGSTIAQTSGVALVGNSLVTATGTGAVSVTGRMTGASSFPSIGVSMAGLATVSSSNGWISVEGSGGAGTGVYGSVGVQLSDAAVISAAGPAKIDLIAMGGDLTATGISAGLHLGNATSIRSTDGDITLQGTGGAGSALAGSGSLGVVVGDPPYSNGSTWGVLSSRLGNVSITGTGGTTGAGSSRGIHWRANGQVRVGQTQSMTLTGIGGSALAAPSGQLGSVGIQLDTSAALNFGSITLKGDGGQSNTSSHGIHLDGPVNTGTTDPTPVMITGTSRNHVSGSAGNHGVYLTGTVNGRLGSVTITGTAGSAIADVVNGSSHGVAILGAVIFSSAPSPTITIVGESSNALFSEAVKVDVSRSSSQRPLIVSSDLAGGLAGDYTTTIIGDTIILSPLSAALRAHTTVLRPKTAGREIVLGYRDNPCYLGLESAELQSIVGPKLIIGDTSAGSVFLEQSTTALFATTISLISGDDIAFSYGKFTAGGDVILQPGAGHAIVSQLPGGFTWSLPGKSLLMPAGSTLRYEMSASRRLGFTVTGNLDISAVNLELSGTDSFAVRNILPVVTADKLIGQFANIPFGTGLRFNNQVLVLNQDLVGVAALNTVSPPRTVASGPLQLNRKTGLFEQTVTITNTSLGTIKGVRLTVTNLPALWRVWNKTSTPPAIQHYADLAPNASTDIVVQFYVPTRQPGNYVPAYTAEALFGNVITPAAKTVASSGLSYDVAVQTITRDSVSKSLPWVIVQPLVVDGSGSVHVTVAPNNSLAPRTGVITIGTATHTITQAAAKPPVIIPVTSLSYVVGEPVQFALALAAPEPATFAAAGLPLGLTINPTTGFISGAPRTSGAFTVFAIARNVAGTSPSMAFTITVLSFPPDFAGAYVGMIGRVPGVADLGGRVDLFVTVSGAVTGKATLGNTAYPLTGNLNVSAADLVHATATLVATALPSLNFTFQFDSGTRLFAGDLNSASARTATSHHNINGWRNVWSITHLATGYAGLHNVVLSAAPAISGSSSAPEFGTGFVSFAPVSSTGNTTVSGKLADGSALAAFAPLGPDGEVLVYQASSAFHRACEGVLMIGTDPIHHVSGTLRWFKIGPALAADRLYPNGFDEVLTANGGLYTAPSQGALVMGLPAGANNAALTFAGGGLTSTLIQSLSLTSPAIVAFAPPNASRISLSVVAVTGQFQGSFTLSTPTPARIASFSGIIAPDAAGAQTGSGFFILPQVPVPPQTAATAPWLSGTVSFSSSSK